MAGDVVLRSSRVTKARETVTVLGTEVNTMATLAARKTWCVEVITVSSSENIIILKMTVVRSQWSPPPPRPPAPAAPGGRWWRGLRAAPCSGRAERARLTVTMTETARVAWSVVTTTATGLVLTSITRTTAVKDQQHPLFLNLHKQRARARAQFLHSQDLVRGVRGGTTMAGDVALQSSRVTKARETVMDLETGVNTTATEAVLETWCAGVITVSSLVCIIILKTTVVKGRQ